jgi:membrane-bound lytic murein transglycosylase B
LRAGNPELETGIRKAQAARQKVSSSFASLIALVFLVVTALPLAARPPPDPPPPSYVARADVRVFIREMADEHGFDRAELRRVFAQARYRREIIAAMDRPLQEPPKWFDYARRLVSPERIEGGVAYWNAHASDLMRSEEQYGVPSEIVVAILGIETFYGKVTGNYRALDALTTLTFDYPRRAEFFRGELKQFLLLARELGVSPLAPNGSFAGALGVPQFMPGSYRSYAVAASGSGRGDLWANSADIATSVANFLVRHQWRSGAPALLPVAISDTARDAVLRRLDGGISERRPIDAWAADGVTMTELPVGHGNDPVGLLMLEEKAEGGESAGYRIALDNFYVLMRYNRSRLYAAAVWELAQAIRLARGEVVR